MKVRNINGTSQNTCGCGSWFKHWEKFSGQSIPKYCPVDKCIEKELVGAHVQRENFFDNNWYIVPLCSAHNGERGKSLDISDYIKLVSANVSETCDK